jgi:hypothetical protein
VVAGAVLALAASPAFAATRELQAQTGVTPGPHAFGDPVGAELDVFVDPGRVDPSSVRVTATFDPYAVVSRKTASHSTHGITELTFRFSLSCLTAACVPDGTEQKIRFVPATIGYRRRDGRTAPRLVAHWPAFRLIARAQKRATITQTALVFGLGGGTYAPYAIFHTPSFPPAASYRARPAVLGTALLGAALLACAATAAAMLPLARQVRRRLAARAERPSVTPLEAALARVEESAADRPGTAEHREALARLARELSAVGLGELVRPATRLAWSAADPTRDESVTLLDRVREHVNGSGA